MKNRVKIFLLVCLWMTFSLETFAVGSPEIIVIGDSQITFSGRKPYYNFFRNIKRECGYESSSQEPVKVGVIGVSSTSIYNWIKVKSGVFKNKICTPSHQRKYVNATTYGDFGVMPKRYEFIGDRKHTQFCSRGRSPLSHLLQTKNPPKLLVAIFLGNAVGRWKSRENAKADVINLINSLPEETSCLFMTSVPTWKKKRNSRRVKAQKIIQDAFKKYSNGRCSFVAGITSELRQTVEGNRRYKKDNFHPSVLGVKTYLDTHHQAICRALVKQPLSF